MDREAWWAIVLEVARVRPNLVTKPPIELEVFIRGKK